jgi:hypothetical protein
MCSHLQKKLFESGGGYSSIWQAIQSDDTLTAVVRVAAIAHLSQRQESVGFSRQISAKDN